MKHNNFVANNIIIKNNINGNNIGPGIIIVNHNI